MQVVKLFSHISFLLLTLMFQPATAKSPPRLAKPNCPDRCGNISIPYPFGIGKDCYMDESFDVKCNETSTSPRAFLRRIDMELVNITLTGGALVKGPVKSVESLGRHEVLPFNLTGSPFLQFSNYFIAVGCNTRVSLWTKNGTTEHTVCDSICSNGRSIANIIPENGECSGQDCCQAMYFPSLEFYNTSFESIDGKQGSDGKKLVLLADVQWFDSKIKSPQDIDNLPNTTVPVSLAWVPNNNSWTYNIDTMDCRMFYTINRTTDAAFNCSCSKGYEGNPYLQCTVMFVFALNTVIGLALGVVFLLIGAWWMHKLIKRKKCIQLKKKFFKRNGGMLLQQQLSSSDGSLQKTKVFSSNELEKATDYFNENRVLGHGGQGTVYKGMLDDGSIAAVKKSTMVDGEKVEEFINEVVILSHINHRNVVRLLGCCLETEVPLLVYEFIPNGTLFRYLHEQDEDFMLSWESRLRIASEAAGAISHLHSSASIPIYHRDIKSTNILLDEKYRAKVSDFGTSRSVSIDQTHLTTKVQGTFGYLDPEYFQTSQLTEKSDVYSFGVVLVELLSGKKPLFLTNSLETVSLVVHFNDSMEDGRIFDIIDAQVKGNCNEEEAMVIANLAKRCLNLNGRNRPTMREVARKLEGILLSRRATAKSPPRLAKPNCLDRCGNISIPYPFGIGKDCYMDESFDVKCNETSTSPRAFLRRIDMELVNITLTGGAVVNFPVIPVESLGRHEVLPFNLEGTPFFLFDNYFIAVGCNTRVSLWTKNGTTEHTVCDSICSNRTSITNIRLENGDCSGADCCQDMGFPSFLQVFNSSLESIEGKQGSDGQKLVLLADHQQWFDSKIKSPLDINNLPYTTVPVSLAWVPNNNSWTYNGDTMDCNVFSTINSTIVSAYDCYCSKGYEGNPYLQCTGIFSSTNIFNIICL
ncbi:wall-associated receptor kinase [Salix suchowensis]|nr:wall-associated receptor kinase [Salix suchowensis]